VLRFGQRASQPKPGRGAQRLLVWLLAATGLVVVLMIQAADPRLWERLGLARREGGDPAAIPRIDNRLREQPAEVGDAVAMRAALAAAESAPEITFRNAHELPALAYVRDSHPFRPEEHAAFLRLLQILQATPEEQLQAASLGAVAYAQLFSEPQHFRGRLVDIHGDVVQAAWRDAPRRYLPQREFLAPMVPGTVMPALWSAACDLTPTVPPEMMQALNYGVRGWYELWLRPGGRGNFPVVIYVLQLPEGFPLGQQLRETVSLTGFFYRIWPYQAQDTLRIAPLVLARSLRWSAQAAPVQAAPTALQWVLIVAGAALFAVLVVVLVARRGGGSPEREAEQILQRLAARRGESHGDAAAAEAETRAALERLGQQPSDPSPGDPAGDRG
jgi:hypothetical protein